jgi:RNA-binding protein
VIELSPAERRRLKAHAHKLHPVVMIGDKRLTEAVLRAIDTNLTSHELIKVKVSGNDRSERESILTDICAAVGASPVQHIGKILVLYRENPQLPAPPPPEPARTKAARTKAARGKPVRTKPARRPGSASRARPAARKARPSK